jgi:hypothetical protein
MWWRLIGSAVEYAATQAPPSEEHVPLDFQKLFVAQEEDEEESGSLADVLAILEGFWPNGAPFKARDVAALLNEAWLSPSASELREILFPNMQRDPSSKSVGRRLNPHIDEPVWHGERTLTLRAERDVSEGSKGPKSYRVEVKGKDGGGGS